MSVKSTTGDILLDTRPVLLKTVKATENKQSLRNCHRPEETGEAKTLKAMWMPSLNPGVEKRASVGKVLKPKSSLDIQFTTTDQCQFLVLTNIPGNVRR